MTNEKLDNRVFFYPKLAIITTLASQTLKESCAKMRTMKLGPQLFGSDALLPKLLRHVSPMPILLLLPILRICEKLDCSNMHQFVPRLFWASGYPVYSVSV